MPDELLVKCIEVEKSQYYDRVVFSDEHGKTYENKIYTQGIGSVSKKFGHPSKWNGRIFRIVLSQYQVANAAITKHASYVSQVKEATFDDMKKFKKES